MKNSKSNTIYLVAALFSLLGILSSVAVIVYSVVMSNLTSSYYFDYVIYGIMLLVVCVLFLAGLSTKKNGLPRVLSLVVTVLLLIFAFLFACGEGTVVSIGSSLVITTVLYFVVSILLLIDAIFQLIYYLTKKNNIKLYFISNYVFLGLIVCLLGVAIADTFVSYNAAVEAGAVELFYVPIHLYASIITLFFVVAIPALVTMKISIDAQEENKEQEN